MAIVVDKTGNFAKLCYVRLFWWNLGRKNLTAQVE
jgi:hypothetical protein